jgi:hypothetical protein
MINLFNGQDIWSDDNSTFPHNHYKNIYSIGPQEGPACYGIFVVIAKLWRWKRGGSSYPVSVFNPITSLISFMALQLGPRL